MNSGLVDLVLAGAQKSGTSTLFEHLSTHPGIDPCDVKEPLFFTDEQGFDTGRPDGPARTGQYALGTDWYDSLFRPRSDRRRLDGSTDYFGSPPAAALLAAHAPQAQIVVMVREPVARLVSHYWHEQRFLDLPPLADLVAADHPRLGFYLRSSRYAANLRRWLDHFPANQLLVATTERLRRDPAGVVADVLARVGLDPQEASVAPTERNVASTTKSKRLHRALTVSRGRLWAERLPQPVQRPLRAVARWLVDRNMTPTDYEPPAPDVLAELDRRLRPDLDDFAALVQQHWPAEADTIVSWRRPG